MTHKPYSKYPPSIRGCSILILALLLLAAFAWILLIRELL